MSPTAPRVYLAFLLCLSTACSGDGTDGEDSAPTGPASGGATQGDSNGGSSSEASGGAPSNGGSSSEASGGAPSTGGSSASDGAASSGGSEPSGGSNSLLTPCDNGATLPAPDGCNTCVCAAGRWACTEIACLPTEVACGARAGDTCSSTEFCAYQEGDLCGAADAEATCEMRPDACLDLYDPVCGCDGNEYSNACAANAAGTGIATKGSCGQL